MTYNSQIDFTFHYAFISVCVVVSIFFTLLMNALLSRVESERKNILLSFYHIPTYYVKFLSTKCGKFLSNHNVIFFNIIINFIERE